MSYLFVNHKGQYERFEEKKDLKRTYMFLLGFGLLGLLIGFIYLMFSYI
mgnify:CR=1 FL=1